MEYELKDLKKAIRNLEAKLNGENLAPFKMKLEFSLLQINTALKVLTGIQTSAADSHNKYLLYKQLETTISEIQTRVQADSRDHIEVSLFAKSSEFSALAATKPFLIEQQKEWLPYYLEYDLQTSFDNENADGKRKIKTLCSAIKGITSKPNLTSEQKTKEIDKKIFEFAESSFAASVFKPKDELKSKVMAWLTIHRQATIKPLLDVSDASSRPEPG